MKEINKSAKEKLKSALDYIHQEGFEAAQAKLLIDNAIESLKTDHGQIAFELFAARGELLRNNGQSSEAIISYNKALAALPEVSEREIIKTKQAYVLIGKATCLISQQELDMAYESLDLTLKIKPDIPELVPVLCKLSHLEFKNDNLLKSTKYAHEAYQLNPENQLATYTYAKSLGESGNLEEAVSLLMEFKFNRDIETINTKLADHARELFCKYASQVEYSYNQDSIEMSDSESISTSSEADFGFESDLYGDQQFLKLNLYDEYNQDEAAPLLGYNADIEV